MYRVLVAFGAVLPLVGCEGDDEAADADVAASLVALLEDGPLPPTMAGGSAREAPPRFCNNGSDDGGIPIPDPIPPPDGDSGGSGSGTASGGVGSSGSSGGLGSTGSTGFDNNSTGGGGTGGFSSGGSFGGSTGLDNNGTSGNTGGGGGSSTGGVDNSSCEDEPIGFWKFDDCNLVRTDLADSGNEGHPAFRAVDVACVPGKEGGAVSIATADDLVYAPDQPGFVLDQGVTVAAWVKPTKVDGVSTLFRKRDDANSAFALLINGKKFQFVVKLASGKVATVSTAAAANVFTHVAATYDGTHLRLYKNGSEVAKTKAVGTLARGAGPLLMGNDISKRRLNGLLDNAWFNTLAAPADTISALTCVHEAPTLSLSPAVGPAVQSGTTVEFSLSVKNNNASNCRPEVFAAFANAPDGFTVERSFVQTDPLAAGATQTFPLEVTSPEEADPGSYPFNVEEISFTVNRPVPVRAQATYVVAEPSGCHVSSGRELMIRDLSVVEDPMRTSLSGPSSDSHTGAWTFARLMEQLAPSREAAADVTERMFRTFLTNQTVNGFPVASRPAMDPVVLQPWPRTAEGKLDLTRAPVRLLAIVNRLDLKDLSAGKAGEGRFVFGVLDSFGNPLEFTVIFEYALVAHTEAEARAWEDQVHALASLPFPSEAYNAALQAITDKFATRGALAGAPNGSALIDIRTNELALGPIWELREFRLSAATGMLEPSTVAQTPDASFNGSPALGRFINQNESIILTERHSTPASFEGMPFAGAHAFNNIDTWDAPGISNPEARHKFSLNTCNGCHGGETQTSFLHINPRLPGQVSTLSAFLTGITVFDPVTGLPRRLAELKRRRELLESIVCESATR